MTKRILVVEDQEDNRQILRDLLGSAGYDIIEAEDGEAGVRAAAAEKPDLILMDIQLPVLGTMPPPAPRVWLPFVPARANCAKRDLRAVFMERHFQTGRKSDAHHLGVAAAAGIASCRPSACPGSDGERPRADAGCGKNRG